MDAELELKVTETLAEDVGRGLARLDPEEIKALKGVLGDVIEITGEKKTVAPITGRRNSLLDSNAPFATGE
jgi:hypothetical protein